MTVTAKAASASAVVARRVSTATAGQPVVNLTARFPAAVNYPSHALFPSSG